jgi:hypothetical protein
MSPKFSLRLARAEVVDPRLNAPSTFTALNRPLLLNCLEGIGGAHLAYREGDGSSILGFVVCHLLDARAYSAHVIGGKLDNRLLISLRSLDSDTALVTYAAVDDLRAAWKQVSDILAGRLDLVAPSELDGPSSDLLPVQERSRLVTLALFFQHESYHIGQFGFQRKRITGRAMRYH